MIAFIFMKTLITKQEEKEEGETGKEIKENERKGKRK
jgi:hypothetical protein